MELLGVQVELPSNTPVMILREKAGRARKLSIFIGGPEAASIAFHLENVEAPRPLTHDLFGTVVGELGFTVDRVVITELEDATFFADIHIASSDGPGSKTVSARPSDAVAIAIRVDAPVFATEELLDEVGFLEASSDGEADDSADPDEVVEEFREFIQNVSPDDFEP